MPRSTRPAVAALAVTIAVLLAAVGGNGLAGTAGDGTADDGTARGGAADDLRGHPATGRFSVVSEAGGAVWAFQPDGRLIVMGPGDLVAHGAWQAGPDLADLDAQFDATVTGQALRVLGAVSPDGTRIALYVEAGEPTEPEAGAPWPSISRLVGERVAMVPDVAPSSSPPEQDCRRPAWVDGRVVDWDHCAADGIAAGSPAPRTDLAEPSAGSPVTSGLEAAETETTGPGSTGPEATESDAVGLRPVRPHRQQEVAPCAGSLSCQGLVTR